jgi:hypothetical protein
MRKPSEKRVWGLSFVAQSQPQDTLRTQFLMLFIILFIGLPGGVDSPNFNSSWEPMLQLPAARPARRTGPG